MSKKNPVWPGYGTLSDDEKENLLQGIYKNIPPIFRTELTQQRSKKRVKIPGLTPSAFEKNIDLERIYSNKRIYRYLGGGSFDSRPLRDLAERDRLARLDDIEKRIEFMEL